MEPTADRLPNEVAQLLGSETYVLAFNAVITGVDPSLLPDDQRAALRRAKELLGTPGPGYPAPLKLDPTRSRSGHHVEGEA